ncbi:Peroxisome biosynthesis protein [Sparassis crispa]|uniref:Peroxisomal ATPase PEX1 n=1 Tax=Sparassis crispa TaxID=139825 RepID=A0A401GU49_9APHY|nr:Peroxisome biosynthesis protein [Sparassis crispa]GBE85761.1 Peroxisome biosynthesis protein [Sparassis crispa]
MPRRARIHFVSLHSSLVNLPISLYGPLVERGIRPQGLAVHLTLTSASPKAASDDAKKRTEAYVGWTGMAASSSLAHFNSGDTSDRGLETIEIDPQYADGLGFALGDIVEIGLLHNLSYATSVATEPVSSDDWEIIELHASHVESTLLSQVRVANIGQEIDVWVLGRTRVRLNVVYLEPSTSGKALLLTTSTEVSIAPKLRRKAGASGSRGGPTAINGSSGSTKVNGINGGINGVSKLKQGNDVPHKDAGKKRRQTRTLRVLPQRIFPPSSPVDSEVAIAYVSRAVLASLDEEPQAVKRVKSWRAVVRRVRPPADPTQEQAGHGPSALAAPAPRVLVPNADGVNGRPPSPAQNDEVVVVWSPEVTIPGGHIVFHGIVDGVDDWDLVRVTFLREEGDIPDTPSHPPGEEEYKMRPSQHGLAGVDDILSRCSTFCLTNFALHAFSKRVRGVPGLLVTGRSGSGKTSILHAIAKSLQEDSKTFAYIHYVDFAKYSEIPITKVRALLKYWMDKASWHRPSVLVFDNVDKLMGAELEHADSFRSRHITEIFLAIYGPSARSAAPNANGVVLLAAAESQAALHPLLNSAHAFQEVVGLKPPGKDARRDIIGRLVRDRMETSDITEEPSVPLNFTALATQTEGYSVTDLKDLVARAVHRAAIRASRNDADENAATTLVPGDFAAAQVDFVPLSLRDVKLQKSEVAWSDIGGLAETKRILRETLEWPSKYGPIFAQSPLRLRSGLLLYGYPGCGKTLLASAVAKECGVNFISIKGPELLNKYIGASEKSVRDLFERASAAKPCVLFFDEFDSIAPKRGHDSTGVTDRVVNQMLTQMDGAEGLDGVYVLAATSRPDLIDSALLRPGRLDKSLLCNMPDASERKDILTALRRKTTIAPSVDFDALAAQTDGFSGADLQALVYNAHLEVIHETIAASESLAQSGGAGPAEEERAIEYVRLGVLGEDGGKGVVTRAEEAAFQRRLRRILSNQATGKRVANHPAEVDAPKKHEISEEHLRRVLKTMRPSVLPEERLRLDHIYRAFVSDRSGELPVPPDAGGVGHRVSLM